MNTTENPSRTSNNKIAEALELLNEAAMDKRHEIKELMTDRYSHIKQAFVEGTAQGKQVLGEAQKAAQEVVGQAEETVAKAVAKIDKSVHENPWPYIGCVAVTSLLLGHFMSSNRK